MTVVPNYYADFHCIGGRCRHSCCIGWEIGIDDATLARYRNRTDDWGQRFAAHIAQTDEPHFIVDEQERCPFLNSGGLCDIQATLGESYLCDICREHPRFHNELPDRTESGLGLCCEEAARLILGQREPMTLCGAEPSEDAILLRRDAVLTLLQDRSLPLAQRIGNALELCEATMPTVSVTQWAELLLSLERLNDSWGDTLNELLARWASVDTAAFDAYMAERQTEYEQLLVYFVYRHAANAADNEQFAARVCFAVMAYTVLHALGAVRWTTDGQLSLEQHCELALAFSAEIEYSDENLYILLDWLGGAYHGSNGT